MNALAMLEIGKVGWIEKERPHCGPQDAILRPLAVAPCTSDVHTVWEGAIGQRHDMVLGHEAVGEVVEVGNMVKDFKVGDRVVVAAITPDWGSVEAQAGFAMHSGGMLAGWKFSNFKDGVFADFFHVNEADANLSLLPDEIDPAEACMLTDMCSTGFHGVELAEVGFGDSVCVIGIGPVGLMSVAGAALSGASHIYAVGSRPNCIEVAKQYGATDIINYKNGSIIEQLNELTKGKGVDKVIVAGGDCDTFIDAVTMVKPGGIVSNVNYLGEGDFVKIPRLEWGVGMAHKTIRGGLMPGGRYRIDKLLSMVLTKRLDPSKIITHRYSGLKNLDQALMLMKDKPRDLIKPVVTMEY